MSISWTVERFVKVVKVDEKPEKTSSPNGKDGKKKDDKVAAKPKKASKPAKKNIEKAKPKAKKKR